MGLGLELLPLVQGRTSAHEDVFAFHLGPR
jgi:hypothetical protein